MPHMLELDTDLQEKLNKFIIGPWRTEVIIDPSGVNIDISDYIDQNSSIIIRKKKNIMPYANIGAFSISEILIRCLNINNEFNHTIKGKLFYHASSRLYNNASNSDTYIDVPNDDADKFDAGMDMTISDINNTVDITLGSSRTEYDYYTRISLSSGAIGEDFNAGAMLDTYYLPGREVTIKTLFDGVSTKINQYKGRLKCLPKIYQEYAEIELYDNFKPLLEISLKANTYKILTDSIGGYQSTLEITRANSSTDTLDMDDIIINSVYCIIGKWKIEFINDSGNFKVTDPVSIIYTGDITTDFYAGTAPYDYQIYIPSSAWSGTDYDEGDIFDFQTILSLGEGITTNNTIPYFLYKLLMNDYGADLNASDIDTSAWNDIIAAYEAHRGAISFTKSITVLKAVELLQSHINACVFLDNEGKISVDGYKPVQYQGTIYSLSPDTDIEDLDIIDLGRIEKIKGQYNYSHDESNYLNEFIKPEGADNTGIILTLNFPAYFNSDRAQARTTMARIFRMWRRGVHLYQINELFNYGIAFDLNEIYKVTSDHPELAQKYVQVYEIMKDIINGNLTLFVYNMDFIYGNYAFTDVDYTDRGKVTW